LYFFSFFCTLNIFWTVSTFFEILNLGGTPFSIGKGSADMEGFSPMVLDASIAGFYLITNDNYIQHRTKLSRTMALIKSAVREAITKKGGAKQYENTLNIIYTLAKEYKFDTEFFQFLNDN
jgi:hypothetical protein